MPKLPSTQPGRRSGKPPHMHTHGGGAELNFRVHVCSRRWFCMDPPASSPRFSRVGIPRIPTLADESKQHQYCLSAGFKGRRRPGGTQISNPVQRRREIKTSFFTRNQTESEPFELLPERRFQRWCHRPCLLHVCTLVCLLFLKVLIVVLLCAGKRASVFVGRSRLQARLHLAAIKLRESGSALRSAAPGSCFKAGTHETSRERSPAAWPRRQNATEVRVIGKLDERTET